MHAVIRETTYPSGRPLEESQEFQAFHAAHASRPGYVGTIVTAVGDGRYVTVTLWTTEKDMNDAREALGPVVQKLLDPMMVRPSVLLGTGVVVLKDF